MTRASRIRFACVAALACVVGIAAAGGLDEGARPAPAPGIAISGVYPAFDRDEPRYVSRCGRGGRAVRVDARRGLKVAVGGRPFRDGSITIEHGARPGADFSLAVRDSGERRSYRIRCLPTDFPAWRFRDFRQSAPGLFTVAFRASPESRPWVLVFDHRGAPRWWFNPPTRALWAQVLSDGSVSWARSFGDGYGLDRRMAHEVRSLSGELLRLVRTRGPIVDGHELRELSGGSYLVGSYAPEARNLTSFGGPADAAIVAAQVQEIDRRGNVRWRWTSRGRIALAETGRWWRNVLANPRRRLQGRAAFDPVHINSIEPRGRRQVVISTRHTDGVYGIDRESGEIAWKLGGTETAESLRIVGDPAVRPFGGQHDARIERGGTLSVYDNGKDRPRRPRVAFYRLRPREGRAIYLGQLNDPAVRSSHCCGSARELPDGGWLVSWGDNPLVTAFDAEGRIAFRLRLAASSFRAVPVPAGAVSIGDLERGMEAMETRRR